MAGLSAYLANRDIGEGQMGPARQATREYVDAYALREARCMIAKLSLNDIEYCAND